MQHISVLLKESIDNLNIKEDGIYIDATLGYAGHSQEILSRVKRGFLFAFDQDEQACLESEKSLKKIGSNFEVIKSNFRYMKEELNQRNVNQVDGIIFDLGVSSPQIDNPKRGFTFMQDVPLDMRMDLSQELKAETIVNNYDENELTRIFYSYAEEKLSKAIAKGICSARKNKKITTTKELVKIIEGSVGGKYFYKYHPERKIFQALRIEVNKELEVLESILPETFNLLKKGGRLCVISFHSLEDRIVKQTFKKYSEIDELVKGLPDIPKEYKPTIKIITKKPILPSEDEIERNSRSKSAKLRVCERI